MGGKLRVGLVGCGGMGTALARHCNSLEDAVVTGVYDPDASAAARVAEEFGAKVYSSCSRLLRGAVDAVIVATPNDLHAPITIEAARRGKHVFCEKPMAMSVADCDAMIEAAEEAGIKLMVGQVLRLFPVFWKTREIAVSGEIGSPFLISVVRLGPIHGLARGWRATKKHSGGVLFEIHVHELDFMRWVMGEAESVYASTGHFTPAQIEFEDTAVVHIRYKSGGIGILHCGTSSAMNRNAMMVQCSEGTLTNGGFGGPIEYARFGEQPRVIEQREIQKEEPYHEEVRSWVDAITKDTPMVFDGHDGRAAIELVEAAYRSAASGKPVRLPLRR